MQHMSLEVVGQIVACITLKYMHMPDGLPTITLGAEQVPCPMPQIIYEGGGEGYGGGVSGGPLAGQTLFPGMVSMNQNKLLHYKGMDACFLVCS